MDGVAALTAAHDAKPLRKMKGERDTEFVKRIVCAYLNADYELIQRRYADIKAKQETAGN
jgi:hypothetical protein